MKNIFSKLLTNGKVRIIRVLSVLVLVAGLGASITPLPVSAASVSWDGDGGDGLWSNPLNWTGDALPLPEDYITISGYAGEVMLDVDFTLTGKITVNGLTTSLRISGGTTLTLNPNPPPGQYDTVILDNGAVMTNDGHITGTNPSSLPRIYVTSNSSFVNTGTVDLTHVFLRGGPQYPALNNSGMMHIVRVSTLVGSIENMGVINSAQFNLQFGQVHNAVSGTIQFTPDLSTMGSRLINSTVFDNEGLLINATAIDNEGIFNNYGTVDNSLGTFTNTCDFNAGSIGIFNNYGILIGNPVIYEGSLWDNDSGNKLWSDNTNWSSNVLPVSTNDIIINNLNASNTTVLIDSDITIDGKLGIRNSAGAPVKTMLVIQPGSTLYVNGQVSFSSDTVINNMGTIVNNGDIRASGTAVFINTGTYTGNPVIGINTIWDGDGGDGLWSNPLNWNLDTVPQTGDYVTISGSETVVMDTDFTLMGRITVTGEGSLLTVGAGSTLTLDPDLGPGQYDAVIIDNGGSIINEGTIQGLVLSPLPRIYVTSTSVYTSDSTFINNSMVDKTDVYMRGGPQNPTAINNGTMTACRLGSLVGSMINTGTIQDAQLNFQFGSVNNTETGSITTTYTLSSMDSRFINSTVFENRGLLTNNSGIDNQGTFNNFSTVDTTSSIFDNQGEFNAFCGSTVLGTISGNPVNQMPCNEAPVVFAGPDIEINEGDTVDLAPATFTDNNTDDTHTATIAWGDGSPVENAVVSEAEGAGNVSGSHVYPDNGLFTVIVTVSDGTDEGTGTFAVNVTNVAPEFDAGPDRSVDQNQPVPVNITFTDPGMLDTHTAMIDWGDGTVVALTVDNVTDVVTGTHMYSWAGTYTVTVTITDNDGAFTADTFVVEVQAESGTMIDTISQNVEDLELPQGTENSLEVSLDNADKKLNDDNQQNDKAAINNLKAMIHKIQAQRGKKIPADEADALIAELEALIDALQGN